MGKETFILKTRYKSVITKLSDKQAGVLFKMLFEYVENGAIAGSTDDTVDMAFEFIKLDLDVFSDLYEKKKAINSDNGRKGGAPKGNSNASKQAKQPKTTETSQTTENNRNKPNENDNENENDKREEQGAATVFDLSNSNLYRQPVIPSFNQVLEQFVFKGGTREMAEKFFAKHDSVGWYLNSSPIKNFVSLIPGFIQSWRDNEPKTDAAPNSYSPGKMVM